MTFSYLVTLPSSLILMLYFVYAAKYLRWFSVNGNNILLNYHENYCTFRISGKADLSWMLLSIVTRCRFAGISSPIRWRQTTYSYGTTAPFRTLSSVCRRTNKINHKSFKIMKNPVLQSRRAIQTTRYKYFCFTVVSQSFVCFLINQSLQLSYSYIYIFSAFILKVFIFCHWRPRNVNPLLMAVLRPISKVAAVLVGRGFRKWWQSLPKLKRELFIQHLRRNIRIYVCKCIVICWVFSYYILKMMLYS